ncbi:MAG: TonB-dependent receptor [Myxococcales bacterium]|nr:TonB-dependent receptor [Myxococcales bacterium]
MTRIPILVLLFAPSIAIAQPTAGQVTDVEVPSVVIEQGNESAGAAQDEALDLANIVQSAAKGVTTVQEAPAIVTVVTSDEIRDRQFQNLLDLTDTAPGWSRVGLAHSTFDLPLVRGQVQAVQFLHDGLSLFDPFVNIPVTNRAMPMELIKRVEMITGPGGVLWGSNSLLGILNVITKDAEDVEGIEAGGGFGNGTGDRLMARAYVMAGKSDLLGGKLKVFAHGSFETYQGAQLDMPLLVFHDPLPQPNSANTYGPLTTTQEAQSMIVNLNAKVTYDKLQIRVSYPMGEMYKPMGLSGEPVRNGNTDPRWPQDCTSGTCKDIVFDTSAIDPTSASKKNRSDTFDRYAVAEYRQGGVTARAYMIEFVRGFAPLQVLAPSQLIQGGLSFGANLTSYRYGGALDGDFELGHKARVLYGAEGFREWMNVDTTTSRQGAGAQSNFGAPDDLTRLPILCPRIWDPAKMAIVPVAGCPLTFAFDAKRTVLGAYVSPQYRPNKQLIFDAGVRAQVAPEALGTLSYPLRLTAAGTVVWSFIPNWHVKLNYAQGFRPPVFNNTSSNGEGVELTGNPNLKVETSDAAQGEINARIFKGERRIRELTFRVDGSYTRLSNLIQITGGGYQNSGDRALMSGEFLGKLYIQGGHRIELGYTWLRVDTSDKGRIRSLPEHWFNLATVFNLVTNRLTATTNLKISGATEDPNRLVEYRGLTYDATGQPVPATGVNVAATDLVLDRLPPIAELSLGLTWLPTSKLAVRAAVYDLLAGHFYHPDVFFDYEPHLEYLPNPMEGFRAYVSALYQY